VDDDRPRYSKEFSDAVKLLATAEKMGLEGIVSKRRNAPYRSGTQKDWVKVNWREANHRWELFQRGLALGFLPSPPVNVTGLSLHLPKVDCCSESSCVASLCPTAKGR
jgi:hypothetical protein